MDAGNCGSSSASVSASGGSDLRSAIPRVSANVLANQLRALEAAGLVERHYMPLPYASRVYMLTRLAHPGQTRGLASGAAPIGPPHPLC